jgi:(p)ppGpp synthase/HD superfamily hydrolase
MDALIAVLKAADAVARWHVNQRRKGSAQEPYVNHLLEVAALVAEATDGDDPELVIAALLHDAIEDQGVTPEEIERTWDKRVADLVVEVTDDKSLPKAVRKQKQEESAGRKSPGAKIIKLADKTSNLRALALSPPTGWSAQRRADYVAWAQRVVAGLRGANAPLESLFEEAVVRASASIACTAEPTIS